MKTQVLKYTTGIYLYLAAFVIAVIISIPLLLPFFQEGYFTTHDGEWAVVRAADMYREIKDMQIPPRYSGVLNHGYGYPLFNFAYPFPYYLTTVLHVIHFGFINSIKILFIASMVFSAYFIFCASKALWKSTYAGFISMFLFVFLPYRFVDLYVRGSLGESVAFILFPLIAWGMVKQYEKPFSKIPLLISAFSYGALVLTHNIMFLYFSMAMVITIAALFVSGKNKSAVSLILTMVFGIILSCYFWLPALIEKNNVLFAKIPIAVRDNFFVSIQQFILPSWGYGSPSQKDGFTYQLGITQLIAYIVGIITLIIIFVKNKKKKTTVSFRLSLFFSILILIFIFFLFPPSNFLWKIIPIMKDITFPWTMLGIIGFLVSLGAGYLGTIPKLRYLVMGISLAGVFFVLPYTKPISFTTRDDSYYSTNDATTTASFEFMPLWVKQFPTNWPKEKVFLINGNGNISHVVFNSKNISFQSSMNHPGTVRFNTIYYPGWTIWVNGKSVPISYNNSQGLMEIPLGSGSSTIQAKFTETPLRMTADVVTLLGILFLLIWLFLPGKFQPNLTLKTEAVKRFNRKKHTI